MRQIGIAWWLYLDDHDDRFPAEIISNGQINFGGKEADYDGMVGGDTLAGERPINPYLDINSEDDEAALEVFHCPSDKRPVITDEGLKFENSFECYGNSYIANGDLTRNIGYNYPLSAITAPYSKLLLVADRSGRPPHGGVDPNIKVNVVFLDGHVKLHNYDADWTSGEVLIDPTP